MTSIEITIFNSIFVFFIGAAIGSFLNVCILRIPREEPLVVDRSRCPHCHSVLRPWELIPLWSFLIQRGRCRHCQKPISFRYFFIELLTGGLFTACYLHFGFPHFLAWSGFCSVLIVIFFIDIDTMYIHYNVLFGGLLFLPMFAFLTDQTVWDMLFGGIVAAAVIWAIKLIGSFILKKEVMGTGDILLMLVLGAFTGLNQKLPLAFFMAIFIGFLYSLYLLIRWDLFINLLKRQMAGNNRRVLAIYLITANSTKSNRTNPLEKNEDPHIASYLYFQHRIFTKLFLLKKLKHYLPFSPFLILGTLIAYFWGNELLALYTKLFQPF